MQPCIVTLVALALAAGSSVADPSALEGVRVTSSEGPLLRIMQPPKGPPAMTYAAQALQQCLRSVSGFVVPVETGTPGPGTISFRLAPDDDRLREDGVAIRAEPATQSIVLTGQNERAIIYSVFVFAEKYLAMRFLAQDCEVAPAQKVITVPAVDFHHSSPFMYRETLYFDSFPRDIALRHRLNGPKAELDGDVGGKWAFHPYVHSFWQLVPAEEYFEDHPEYYSLVNGERTSAHIHGQLCLTNPDVLEIATRQVLHWIEEYPDTPIIDVSQNDGNGWCECENCSAVVAEEGSQHGPILRFVNAIADVVAEKHPDKWIETLAYAYATKPPAITKPRDNVIIRLCHAGCYFHGFEACGLGANLTTYLEEWSQRTQRIFIWHYATNFAHYIAPNQNLRGLAADIQYYADHGVNGLMVQSNYQSHGGELAELRQYLAAQLMWDPGQDPRQVVLDFCHGYYEDAAPQVLALLALMDEEAKNPDVHAFGAWDPTGTASPEFVARALALLQPALNTADGVTRARLEKLMLPFWYLQLTHPSRYNLDPSDGADLLEAFRVVVAREGITHINEGRDIQNWLEEMAPSFAEAPAGLVYDLRAHLADAAQEDCVDWRASTIHRIARATSVDAQDALLPGAREKEGTDEILPSILQHPPLEGWGKATFVVALPEVASGEALTLYFGTGFSAATENGVDFAVDIDGTPCWQHTQASQSVEDHHLDLSPWAGRELRITLRVHGKGNGAFDWANWAQPRILRE